MNEKLTLSQITDLKQILEKDLLKCINHFSEQTGIYEISINMIDVFSEGKDEPFSTDLKVKLKIYL